MHIFKNMKVTGPSTKIIFGIFRFNFFQWFIKQISIIRFSMFSNENTYDIHFFSLRIKDFDFIFRVCTDFYQRVLQKKTSLSTKEPLRRGWNPVIHTRASDVLQYELSSLHETNATESIWTNFTLFHLSYVV